MSDLYGILVVYNKSVLDCPTYLFCRDHLIPLVVCDNSTGHNENENFVLKDGFIYISMQGNQGLSKAYNAALDALKGQNGYVLLLDDDTTLSDDFLEAFKNRKEQADIYLPIVEDEVGMMSPCRIENQVVSRTNSIKIDYEHLTGINAGMIIQLSCFLAYRYDENLFLDYVDHFFLAQMKEQKKYIAILPITIHQKFSANDPNKKAAITRFTIFKHDSAYFYKSKLRYCFVVGKRRVRLCWKFKDLSFLFL